jgi:hypothetical protein
MWEVMTCCVIMHTMIVEQEHDNNLHDQGWQFQYKLVELEHGISTFEEFLHMHVELRDKHILLLSSGESSRTSVSIGKSWEVAIPSYFIF